MREIDVSGMSCPEPVIRTQNEIKNMAKGEKLCVIVDNETAKENITRLVTGKNCQMTAKKEGDRYFLEIEVL